jgi:hypothetical protein
MVRDLPEGRVGWNPRRTDGLLRGTPVVDTRSEYTNHRLLTFKPIEIGLILVDTDFSVVWSQGRGNPLWLPNPL